MPDYQQHERFGVHYLRPTSYTRDTRALRTAFRERALEVVHRAALGQLGPAMTSAVVSTWSQPGEPDSRVLELIITADASRAELRRAGHGVLEAVAREAASWTDEQRRDYSARIYFDLDSVDQ